MFPILYTSYKICAAAIGILYLTLDWLGIPPKAIHPAVHTGSTHIHVPWYSNSCTLPVKPISAHGEITMGPQLRIVHQAYSYQPKLYQFAVWSSGRLAAGFEPGTFCMGGVCASHYTTQPTVWFKILPLWTIGHIRPICMF